MNIASISLALAQEVVVVVPLLKKFEAAESSKYESQGQTSVPLWGSCHIL